MLFKYELLKKPVMAAGLNKRWLSSTTEKLPEKLNGPAPLTGGK